MMGAAAPIAIAVVTSCSEGTSSDVESSPAPERSEALGAKFLHGVASGDPLRDSVVLWTRVSPSGGVSAIQAIDWRVATDPEFSDVVAAGVTSTSSDRDFTVKVDVTGLSASTTYYYQFGVGSELSSAGRTRTLPSGSVDHMRLAVASCANYPGGYFHGYRKIAERSDLDLVLHLGDYLYEYGNFYFGDGAPLGRVPEPDREIVTLSEYRLRHRQYKTDPDLQEAHRQHAFVTIWDDHEIANDANATAAQNHQPASEGSYGDRRQAAVRAYMEWMPIRELGTVEEPEIFRSFTCGDLLKVTMLDSRLAGRDHQIANPCDVPGALDPGRSLLGDSQEEWLFSQLDDFSKSDVIWNLVAQQVMLAQVSDLEYQCVADPDQWDGYPASRDRLLNTLMAGQIDNVVIVTGDAHSSWASDIASNPFEPQLYDAELGEGSLAVEFVVPGISSAGPGGDPGVMAAGHPHVKYSEFTRQGYMVLDVTKERTQADWYYVDDVRSRNSGESLGASFGTRTGANRVLEAQGESAAKPSVLPAP